MALVLFLILAIALLIAICAIVYLCKRKLKGKPRSGKVRIATTAPDIEKDPLTDSKANRSIDPEVRGDLLIKNKLDKVQEKLSVADVAL